MARVCHLNSSVPVEKQLCPGLCDLKVLVGEVPNQNGIASSCTTMKHGVRGQIENDLLALACLVVLRLT